MCVSCCCCADTLSHGVRLRVIKTHSYQRRRMENLYYGNTHNIIHPRLHLRGFLLYFHLSIYLPINPSIHPSIHRNIPCLTRIIVVAHLLQPKHSLSHSLSFDVAAQLIAPHLISSHLIVLEMRSMIVDIRFPSSFVTVFSFVFEFVASPIHSFIHSFTQHWIEMLIDSIRFDSIRSTFHLSIAAHSYETNHLHILFCSTHSLTFPRFVEWTHDACLPA